MIVIADYGVGNLASLTNIFDFIGVEAIASSDPGRLASASRIVLPGVGAFDQAMQALNDSRLVPVLEEAVLGRSIPVLGVCLGMQLLASDSEEGHLPGLGWIKATARRISPSAKRKVPNNGWHQVLPRKVSPLFPQMELYYRYYFNHSYYLECSDLDVVAAEIEYGGRLTCAVARENILGVQFHPEKSHKFGMELLARFAGETL